MAAESSHAALPFLPILHSPSLRPAALPSISRWRWGVRGWWEVGGSRRPGWGHEDCPLANCHRLWDWLERTAGKVALRFPPSMAAGPSHDVQPPPRVPPPHLPPGCESPRPRPDLSVLSPLQLALLQVCPGVLGEPPSRVNTFPPEAQADCPSRLGVIPSEPRGCFSVTVVGGGQVMACSAHPPACLETRTKGV